MSENTISLKNPYLLLTLTTLFWAGNAIAGKMANGHVSPFLLTTSRWAIASLILLPIAWPHLKRDWPIIKENFVFLVICGGLGFTVFNNLLYLALTYISAINAAIEQASMPLAVFLLNYLLYKTRTTSFQVIGFIITMFGVIITASRGDLASLMQGDFNIGDLIMLLAIMFYGMYSVILRNKPNISLLSFMATLSVIAFFVSIPFTLFEASTDKFILPDTIGWGVILYAALFPSIVAQLFWVMGLEQIGSNRGGLFINLLPIFGTVLAILILGETFEIYHAIGGILVLAGVALAQKQSPNKS